LARLHRGTGRRTVGTPSPASWHMPRCPLRDRHVRGESPDKPLQNQSLMVWADYTCQGHRTVDSLPCSSRTRFCSYTIQHVPVRMSGLARSHYNFFVIILIGTVKGTRSFLFELIIRPFGRSVRSYIVRDKPFTTYLILIKRQGNHSR
jgi:hypothetical protein